MIKPKTKPIYSLIGVDGHALNIVGIGAKALKEAGADSEYINQYKKEALSGDYENVIQTTMKYCDVT